MKFEWSEWTLHRLWQRFHCEVQCSICHDGNKSWSLSMGATSCNSRTFQKSSSVLWTGSGTTETEWRRFNGKYWQLRIKGHAKVKLLQCKLLLSAQQILTSQAWTLSKYLLFFIQKNVLTSFPNNPTPHQIRGFFVCPWSRKYNSSETISGLLLTSALFFYRENCNDAHSACCPHGFKVIN